MNRKTNTLLFILGATAVNIVITLLCFFIYYLPYSWFLAPRLPPGSIILSLAVIFIVALATSFIVYQVLLKLFMKKVDVKKYFDSLVGSKK
ncbi:hypothetical protein TREPR_0769 [Treponema primitia ZAS-2]|uniref:Uncharacterized protein n=1 Tax=Treponema primitia (strain ATCC BAA-887 / DSM 12427 / ZAS-2) TaxID=545694 RepID=F5YJC2_TREPZ|nr:hypothetical protein [Treponema primitia]AEF84635.1 hypothetical protein TREPR_0769 [Treponema primitia ZAS-2]